MTVRSYPSLFTIGHRSIEALFDGEVVVQEKIDGSQFSFQVDNGEVKIRSKGTQINIDAPDKMFAAGVTAVKAVSNLLTPGFIYRGEYLRTPKHNVLAYERIPKNHVAIFDIEDANKGEGYFLTPEELMVEASRIGFDVVPVLKVGKIKSVDVLKSMLDNYSILGGAKIEGVVIKNYAKFTEDKKVMMGKFVSEAFKESHKVSWRKSNPTQSDVVTEIISCYKTTARWAKAVQHLREDGKITDSAKDIALLIKEIPQDVRRECEVEIKEILFAHFWPQIQRGILGGMPEWYKAQVNSLVFPPNKE